LATATTTPTATAITQPEQAEAPTFRDQVSSLVTEWVAAQNARDMKRYEKCYASSFVGVRRTPNGTSGKMTLPEWLKDRASIYSEPVEVVIEDENIQTHENLQTAEVYVLQRFRRGSYAEHGHKKLEVLREGDGLRFVSEEMTDSKRGWDDREYAEHMPTDAATCEVSFNPLEHKYFVAISRQTDYAEAMRAVAKLRKREVPAEIVRGEDFVGLEQGFWVVAGASDDEGEAKQWVARLHEGTVTKIALDPKLPHGMLKLVGAHELRGIYSSRNVTVAGGKAFVATGSQFGVLLLTEPSVRETFGVPNSRINPVRMATHDGRAHVLDQEGHWHRVEEDRVEQVPSFDPSSTEGDVAELASWRFELNEHGDVLVHRKGESVDGKTLLPLAPESRSSVAVFKVTDDRLAIVRGNQLYVFDVIDPAPHMTKICGTVATDEGLRLRSPALIEVGGVSVATDKKGQVELWSASWGFIQPTLSAVYGKLVKCEGEYESEESSIGVLTLFGQPSLEITASAGCYVQGD
jgi:hypothetical protein